MMSSRGRQEIPEKQIVNPLSLEQRIRRDINRAQRTRDGLAHVMSLKLISDKSEVKKPPSFEEIFVMAVRKYLTSLKASAKLASA